MRNTLRPTGKSGRPSTLTKLLATLVVAALVGLYWVAPPDWSAMPTDMVEKVTLTYDPEAFDTARDESESDLVSGDDEEEPAPQEEKNTPHAETSSASPEPVESRPVAAAVVVAAPVQKVATPPATWRVRLGLCLYTASCADMARKLKAKGIAVLVRPSTASLRSVRVVVGPWSTRGQAKDAATQLDKSGLTTSLFTAEGESYLTSAPLTGESAAKSVAQKVASHGYTAKVTTRKEVRKVQKVFLVESYKNKKEARAMVARLKQQGVAAMVERSAKPGGK